MGYYKTGFDCKTKISKLLTWNRFWRYEIMNLDFLNIPSPPGRGRAKYNVSQTLAVGYFLKYARINVKNRSFSSRA